MIILQTYYKIYFVILIVILGVACSENSSTESKEESFSGILMTDEEGNILGGDTTDFQPRPINGNNGAPLNYSLVCAYPNPVLNDTVTIKFQVPQPDSIIIKLYDKPNSGHVEILLNTSKWTGIHQIRWINTLNNGIYRVTMNTDSGFYSYGDIEFKDN